MSGGVFSWVSDTHFRYPFWSTALKTVNEIADEIATYLPTAIFHTGDITADNQASQYADYNEWLSRTLCNRYYTIPGNHDAKTDAISIYDSWHTLRHFSVERFGIRWIAFYAWERVIPGGDIVADLKSDELAWIESELAAAGDVPIILMAHYPLLPIWGGGNIEENNDELTALIAEYGVKAYLSGHMHGTQDTSTVGGCVHVNGYSMMSAFVIGTVTESSVTLEAYDSGTFAFIKQTVISII